MARHNLVTTPVTRAVFLERGMTTRPACPATWRRGAFPQCGIVVHIAGSDHKSILRCLWAGPRHISK